MTASGSFVQVSVKGHAIVSSSLCFPLTVSVAVIECQCHIRQIIYHREFHSVQGTGRERDEGDEEGSEVTTVFTQ